jgi:porphobilinogen synthase
MPEVKRYSPDRVIEFISPLYEKGLAAILLFGVPDTKDIEQTWVDDGIVQKRIPEIRKQLPEIEVITDVCLCSYSRNGHCHTGDNDETSEILGKIAVSHARSGAQVVVPSANPAIAEATRWILPMVMKLLRRYMRILNRERIQLS